MRRQSEHVQRVHAFIFAGAITASIASVILYTDYGFWHEKYDRNNDLIVEGVITSPKVAPEPPSEMFSRFWNEARTQFGNIGQSGASMLEGKEIYSK